MLSLSILDKKTLFSAGQKHQPARKAILGVDAKPRLKGFQDAIAFAQITKECARRTSERITVADIGGDQSRLLPLLLDKHPNMDSFIVDTWSQSIGNGTTQRPDVGPRIELIDALLGQPETSKIISDNSFDIVTSISVVEHVPEEDLTAFFADSLRICKPGGVILHYIDLHINDEPVSIRGEATAKALELGCGPLDIRPDSWAMQSRYASNPDSMMFRWGERGENMAFRARMQAICMIARIDKPLV